MKKGLCLSVLAALSLALAGCSEDLGNTFNKGTDYQFSQRGNVDGVQNVQCTDDGDYIYYQSFVYFYDNESQKLVPLCNKPNCLHDQEKDSDRIGECNAYVDDVQTTDSYISYYDGAVYVLERKWEEDLQSLVRISADGSKKETVLTLKESEGEIDAWMIHRGRFYYAVKEYNLGEDNQVHDAFSLKWIPVSGKMSGEQSKTLWQSGDDVNASSFSGLQAYGNYVYFRLTGTELGESGDGDEEPSFVFASYACDIEKDECREIAVPQGEAEGTMIAGIDFLDSNLLLSLYDYEGDYHGGDDAHKMTLYLAELDGTDPQPWMEGVEQGKCIQSTGTQVLISDGVLTYGEDGPMTYEVYDADANLVDSFVYPHNHLGMVLGIGFDGRMIRLLEDDTTWEVECVDLASIGQLHGATVEPELLYKGNRNLALEYESDFGAVLQKNESEE